MRPDITVKQQRLLDYLEQHINDCGRVPSLREAAATHGVEVALGVNEVDARGSTLALTEDDGTITDQYRYAPYGGVIARNGANEGAGIHSQASTPTITLCGGLQSLMVSLPPAMPASICPNAILLPTRMAASSAVPQARCRSRPGVSGDKPQPSTDSRQRLKSRECFITAPAATSSRRTPWRSNLSTRPRKAAVNIAWLPTRA